LCLNRIDSLSYMELMNLLNIKNTGRLNYHLKTLDNLIEKRNDGKYQLTERVSWQFNSLRIILKKFLKPIARLAKAFYARAFPEKHCFQQYAVIRSLI
jgi:hypothetical protein